MQSNLETDANGNLITGDGNFREYNSLNQLIKIYNGSDDSGLLLEEYTYNPIEERVLVKKVYNNDSSLKETVYYFSQEYIRMMHCRYSQDPILHSGSIQSDVQSKGSDIAQI